MTRHAQDPFEAELRSALDAGDPGPAFTARVLDAVARRDAPRDAEPPAVPAGRPRTWRWLLPLAATVALGVSGAHWFGEHRELQRARAAQAQIREALRVTSEKLNIVHGVVERQRQ
jgi:hypothetical protein